MRCVECDNNQQLKEEQVTVRYQDCGLDNVILYGVQHSRCENCGEEYYGFGDLDRLHNLIARIVISKKGPVNEKELRFLRKRLGYSGAMFAERIGINPQTLSRYENGKLDIPRSIDIMLRSLVGNSLPDRAYDLHDILLNQKGKAVKKIELESDGGEWSIRKAA